MTGYLAERLILEAIEAGDFDSVEGQGKPLPGIDDVYDAAWWAKAWVRRELDRDPPVVSYVRNWLDDLEGSVDEHELRVRLEESCRLLLRHGFEPIDIERAVTRWRRSGTIGWSGRPAEKLASDEDHQ